MKSIKISIAILFAISIGACRKSEVTSSTFPTDTKVSLGGYLWKYKDGSMAPFYATNWQNSVQTILAPTLEYSDLAQTVCYNNSFYSVGSGSTKGGKSHAMLWGEQTQYYLGDTNQFASFATGLAISKTSGVFYTCGTVYPSGGRSTPAVWIDHDIQLLPLPAGARGEAIAIRVVEQDVYVMADVYTADKPYKSTPTMYKNGDVYFTIDAFTGGTNIKDFEVFDGEVYSVGWAYINGVHTGAYFLNSTYLQLPSMPNGYFPKGIEVMPNGTSNDIHIVGVANDPAANEGKAFYLKNFEPVPLEQALNAECADIEIVGTDVYIGGRKWNAQSISGACYWKNGKIEINQDATTYHAAKTIAVRNN